VPGFDVVLESVGGSVLASVLGGLAVGGQVVSYGAAAGEPDPAPPPVPDLRTQNLTITGFSILNRARKAPPKALSLIQGVFTLTQDGLRIPAPAVVDWAEAIDAHIAQSEGRSRGKTVVRL
jgi:NADPH2:quinone reductase